MVCVKFFTTHLEVRVFVNLFPNLFHEAGMPKFITVYQQSISLNPLQVSPDEVTEISSDH